MIRVSSFKLANGVERRLARKSSAFSATRSFARYSQEGHHQQRHHASQNPQPLPAVAYAYDEDSNEESVEYHDYHSGAFSPAEHGAIFGSVPGWGVMAPRHTTIHNNGSGSSSYPPPPPSQAPSPPTPVTSKKSGDGGTGSGGRHRCPKCGTFVTFRHGEFEDNTFYCAACSGWFVISPDAMPTMVSGGSVASAGETYGRAWDGRNLQDPQIPIMHNVPDKSGLLPPQEDVISEATGGDKETNYTQTMPTPKEIMSGLDEYVIGQKRVKVALSVGVYNHYKRIFVTESSKASEAEAPSVVDPSAVAAAQAEAGGDGPTGGPSLADLNLGQHGMTKPNEVADASAPTPKFSITDNEFVRDVEDCEIDKSNILLLGPTGSGKTLLVKTLAKLIDVPLVISDATCLTQAGYVGEDVESILLKLYHEAGRDLERCQKGIVYIDECDKIRKSGGNMSISRDVSGEGVQHALLKIVEGNVINAPKEPGRKNPRGDFLQIDTSNILFICGGAFSGLERIINRRMDAASIGFGAKMKKAIDDPKVQGRYFDNAIPKDLVEFGMIPEFVGRFPVIVSTKGLDKKNLVDILTVPKNSIMKQYRRLFAMDDVNFHVTESGLDAIAETATARGTGARGLRSITDSVLMDTQYVVPSIPGVETVYLDDKAVNGTRSPILLREGLTVQDFESYVAKNSVDGDVGDDFELPEGAEYVSIDELEFRDKESEDDTDDDQEAVA